MRQSFKLLKKGGALASIKGQDTDGLAKTYDVSFDRFFTKPNGAQRSTLAEMITKGTLNSVIEMKADRS